jgi:adenylate cyclase
MNDFAIMEIDYITVKGKTEPETIYTILGGGDVLHGARFQEVHAIFKEMLALYRNQDFEAAFKSVARGRAAAAGMGLDTLFDIYEARIRAFRDHPPPKDWNGVFVLETK